MTGGAPQRRAEQCREEQGLRKRSQIPPKTMHPTSTHVEALEALLEQKDALILQQWGETQRQAEEILLG